MSTRDTGTAATGNDLNRTVALVFGAVYTLVGIAGFFVANDVDFAGEEGSSLLGFDVNHLHNIVHLLIGLALLGASRAAGTARAANLTVGVTYLALAVIGPFVNDTEIDIIGLNGADHWLHAVSGLVLAGTALVITRDRRRTDAV
jgi:hypothetical protein